MAFENLKKRFKGASEEKYEILYHKYSQLKLENQKLKEQHNEELKDQRDKIMNKMTEMLLNIQDDIEEAKNSSFKVDVKDKNVQKLLVDLNKVEQSMGKILTKLNIEAVTPKERFYDPELHEVSSYSENKDMKKGIILKVVKKGWKYKDKVLRKPKVVVNK